MTLMFYLLVPTMLAAIIIWQVSEEKHHVPDGETDLDSTSESPRGDRFLWVDSVR
jgi:hypothetical protein